MEVSSFKICFRSSEVVLLSYDLIDLASASGLTRNLPCNEGNSSLYFPYTFVLLILVFSKQFTVQDSSFTQYSVICDVYFTFVRWFETCVGLFGLIPAARSCLLYNLRVWKSPLAL